MSWNPSLPVTQRATAAGNTAVIPAQGAGNQIIVRKGSVHNRGNALSPVVSLQAGGNPAKWVVRLPANGGDAYFDFGDNGWPLAPNLPLNVNLGAAGDVDVNITEWIVEDIP
jgi:hypothetical protein